MNTAFGPNDNLPKGGKNTYFRGDISESLRFESISDCLCKEASLMTFLLLVKGPRSFAEIQESWNGDPLDLKKQLMRMFELGLLFMEKHGGATYYFIHGDKFQPWVDLMIETITTEPYNLNSRWFHCLNLREDLIGLN